MTDLMRFGSWVILQESWYNRPKLRVKILVKLLVLGCSKVTCDFMRVKFHNARINIP